MGDDGGVASVLGHLDGSQSFGQGTDLVELDQDGVGDAVVDTALQDLGVGYEQVVTHDLDFLAQFSSLVGEAFPVRFVQAIFDGDDRELGGQVGQVVGELVGGEDTTFALQVVLFLLCVVELGSSAVHGQGDVGAQLVTGSGNGFGDHFQRFGVGLQVRCETAFVAHCSGVALGLQYLGQVVEDLGTHADGFFQGLGANRLDHELLDVDVVVGVLTTVDDVHHGQRHGVDTRGAVQLGDVGVQRQALGSSSGFGVSQGNGQDGVGAELGFVLGTVEVDHDLVNSGLVLGIFTQQSLSDRAVYGFDGFQHAFTQETALVAVTQFQRFAGTGGRARRSGCHTNKTTFQVNFGLNGRVTTGVDDFTTDHFNDLGHVYFLRFRKKTTKICQKKRLRHRAPTAFIFNYFKLRF